MREQRPRVDLLRLDERRVEAIQQLRELEPLGGHALEARVAAGDVQVDVRVDAVLGQLGDEEVEPIELRGIERVRFLNQEADRRGRLVHEVKADQVDAEAPKVDRGARRHLVRGEAGGRGAVDAEEPHARP